jgi:hypothetical protein
MDWFIILITVVLIFLLITVYVLTSIKYTDNLDDLFDKITTKKPTATSFTLGRLNPNDPTSLDYNKFRNVVIDKLTGKPIIQENDYPLDLQGNPVAFELKGTFRPLPDNGDGFTIDGFEFTTFKCPTGYTGPTCKPKPLCGPNDKNTYKPLTYTQFNQLGLYLDSELSFDENNQAGDGGGVSRATAEEEPTNKRIRVHCLSTNGDYKLETCPANTLLDETLNCKIYDICQDRVNGFKHAYAISSNSPQLTSKQYYMCMNNVSVLKTCPGTSVFSKLQNTCIAEGICFGKGDATFKVDPNRYIQCRKDIGRTVDCDLGVVELANGVYSCGNLKCEPSIYYYQDANLRYATGYKACESTGESTIVQCNDEKNPRVYTYKWAEEFTYVLDGWPKERLFNEQCISVPQDDDTIISNPYVMLKWSDAMWKAHKFNLRTGLFVCEQGERYLWNYQKDVIMPSSSLNQYEIFNPAFPCQTVPLKLEQIFLFAYTLKTYPEERLTFIYIVEQTYLHTYEQVYFWPVYDRTNKVFMCSFITLDVGTKLYAVSLQKSSLCPIGFEIPDNTEDIVKLKLSGYSDAPALNNEMPYFISSGNITKVPIVADTQALILYYDLITSIKTDENSLFTIDFSIIVDPIVVIKSPLVEFHKTYFKIEKNSYPAGYLVMRILKKDENTRDLVFGDGFEKVAFDKNQYPTLTFTN